MNPVEEPTQEPVRDPVGDIERIIAPSMTALGFELVRVRWTGAAARAPVLQIMAERPDGTMTADDCAELSRAVSALLDVEDPVPGEYVLEVSSPGIDRPLVKAADFQRFAGFETRIELRRPVDGRRRFRGRLEGLAGEAVKLIIDGRSLAVPLDDIAKAKLVLTEDLIAAPPRPVG